MTLARILRMGAASLLIGIALALTWGWWWWLRSLVWLGLAFFAWRVVEYPGSWVGWLRIKLREWSADVRQLWLWAGLAFKPGRTAIDTATMAHQQQFLQGRIMSPMNIFTVLPLVLALGGVSFGAFNGWRVDRLKDARDAPCSERELSQTDAGAFRTTRAACAQLGATNEVAQQWRERAEQVEQDWSRDVRSIREETAAEIARLQRQTQARVAVATNQRRRTNEGIEAALGGEPPNLERSLCELAGHVDCGPASGSDGATGAPASDGVPRAE